MRSPVRTLSVAVLLVMVALSVAATVASATTIKDQEGRLLRERAAEVALDLSGAVAQIPATFQAQGAVLRATDGSVTAYRQAAAAATTTGGMSTYAWLRALPGGQRYQVLAAVGSALTAGEVVTGTRVATFASAAQGGQLVATSVFGARRQLGFALGPPTAPPGTVLYRESTLGALSPPRESGSAPFAELDVAIYASPVADPGQVVTSTTVRLPLHGQVRSAPFAVGSRRWSVSVRARRPLVGAAAAMAPWLVAGAGAIGAILVATLVEIAGRRRDAALALYASEHQMAETLQRSLLPLLPQIGGVTLAARYIAAGQGQEVGGDWFDVFPLPRGMVGVVVGDVMGHDLAAAAAMSQIRAALRAYAIDGDPPEVVLNRLDHLVTTFDLTPLVTVVYGVLEAPAVDGSRWLRFSNAGHLPPMLRTPDGCVRALEDGASVLIGAPSELSHVQAERRLGPGSTLVLFTDGLVEVRGESLQPALDELAAVLTTMPVLADADEICERLLTIVTGVRHDDIAVLAVQMARPVRPADPDGGSRPRRDEADVDQAWAAGPPGSRQPTQNLPA